LIIIELSSGFLFGLQSGLQFLQNPGFSTSKFLLVSDQPSRLDHQNKQQKQQIHSASSGKFIPQTLSFFTSNLKFYFFWLYIQSKQNTPRWRLNAFNTS